MKWDKEQGYVEFKTAYKSIRNSLGLSEIDYISRTELAPYITKIFKYLNEELIMLGDKATLKEKIEKVMEILEKGANNIVDLKIEELEVSLDVLDKSPDDEVKYSKDRFIFSWTNIMSTLCQRLRLQYYDLLKPKLSDGECPCCCGKGQTQKDWENWKSGIWPEDEEAERYGSGLAGQPSWRPSLDIPDCLCGGR